MTDLDRLALILQIITLSKGLLCLSLYFKYTKLSTYPDLNRSFLTGNEECYHYIIGAIAEVEGLEPPSLTTGGFQDRSTTSCGTLPKVQI